MEYHDFFFLEGFFVSYWSKSIEHKVISKETAEIKSHPAMSRWLPSENLDHAGQAMVLR